jgi:hypothetical protein
MILFKPPHHTTPHHTTPHHTTPKYGRRLITLSCIFLFACQNSVLQSTYKQSVYSLQGKRPMIGETKGNPIYGNIYTDTMIDEALKAGASQQIEVYFKNDEKVRMHSKHGKRTLFSKNDRSKERYPLYREGNQTFSGQASLASILNDFDAEIVENPILNDLTPQEIERLFQYEQEQGATNMPHPAGMMKVNMNNFELSKFKALIQKLQSHPTVQGIELLMPLKEKAVEYTQTPTDPKFPNLNDYPAQDWNNTKQTDSFTRYKNGSPFTIPPANVGSWWFNRHSIGRAWQLNPSKGSGVKVAVIDSSFKTDNSDGINWDLGTKMAFKWESATLKQNNDVSPTQSQDRDNLSWHGTAMAHILGAKENNGIGLCGVAPGVTVVPLKVDLSAESIGAAIRYAVKKAGAKVISVSIGPFAGTIEQSANYSGGAGNPYYDIVKSLEFAANNGVLVVAAAGNENVEINHARAAGSKCIVVGGINRNNQAYFDTTDSSSASGTNFGSRIDIAAAGQDVATGIINGLYPDYSYRTTNVNGTSISAPMVAGVAALLFNYTSNADEVGDILLGTADWTNTYGTVGRLVNTQTTPATITYTGVIPKPMCGNVVASTGNISYTRVLNAASAIKLIQAYSASTPNQVYRPASSEFTRIARPGASNVEGYFPFNALMSFAGSSTVTCTDYIPTSSTGVWAGASTKFVNKRLIATTVTGTPYLKDAQSILRTPAYNNSAQANNKGYLNNVSYSF